MEKLPEQVECAASAAGGTAPVNSAKGFSMFETLISIAEASMRASGTPEREIESAVAKMRLRHDDDGSAPSAAQPEEGESREGAFPVVDKREIESATRKSRIAFSRESCFMGFPDYRSATFDSWTDIGTDEGIKATLMAYASEFEKVGVREGVGLLLYGKHGRGKTYAACCVANAVIDRGYRALVMSMSDIMGTSPVHDVVVTESMDADLVVIDDFGAERTTAYGREQVYAFVNRLYSAGKPLVVTTNLDHGQLQNPPKELLRELERIKERCHRIEYVGPNRRRPPDLLELFGAVSQDAPSGEDSR